LRLIVDNGKVEYDIPYDSVLLEVRESNGGAGLMYCGAVSQMSIYAFSTIEQGKNVLQEIATANGKGCSYYYLCRELESGIAVP